MFQTWIQLFMLLCASVSCIYGQNSNCDSLRRCQQRLSTIIQDTQSYSGISSGYQTDQQSKCRTVREDLDCLLAYNHQCQYAPYSSHSSTDQQHNTPDLIRRTKTYLESVCDRGAGWRSISCYQRDEVRQCEVAYTNQYVAAVSNSSCRNYQIFRNCAMNALTRNCNADDVKMLGTYLIDKAQEHSWSCSPTMDGQNGNYPHSSSNYNNYNNNPGGYNTGMGYNSGQYQRCDESQLRACQQRVSSSVQDYQSFGSSSDWQSRQSSNCNNMRSDLECLLNFVPLCQSGTSSYGSSSSYGSHGSSSSSFSSSFGGHNNADLIRRAKSYVESVCDRSQGGWRSSQCFRRSDVRDCETQFNSQYSTTASDSSCRNYNNFKQCVSNIIRHSCSSHDQLMLSPYLIDKGQELAWSCAPSTDYGQGRYGGYNPSDRDRQNYPLDRDRHTTGYDYNRGGIGGQYGGQQQGQYGQYGSNNDRYNQYGSQSPGTDHCIQRVKDFTNGCEEQLHQRQRDARETQNHNEMQERICCSLYLYRDCLSRAIRDKCQDPNPIVVDILMGSRKGDLTDRCRHVEPHQCSDSSQSAKQSFGVMFLCFTAFLMLFLAKY